MLAKRTCLFLLLLLVLMAPVANAWCSTVCVAAAISSGCAHVLQPTDDLPVDRVAQNVTVLAAHGEPLADSAPQPERTVASTPERHTPLRI